MLKIVPILLLGVLAYSRSFKEEHIQALLPYKEIAQEFFGQERD